MTPTETDIEAPSPSIQSAASKYVSQGLEFHSHKIAAVEDCYSEETIRLAATATDTEVFDVGRKLQNKFRDFKIQEWKRRIRAERDSLAAEASTTGESDNWRSLLLKTETGAPKPLLANAITALRKAKPWAGAFLYDEFAQRPVRKIKDTIRFLRDEDDIEAADWLQHQGIHVSSGTTHEAISAVCREHPYHPVRTYLDGLNWDGTRRINTWLEHYIGVEPTPYTEAIGAKWLISAVARVMQPGCKADHMLVLEGPQGAFKSTALKTLFGEAWFTDRISDFHNKDSSQELSGIWAVEFGELDSFNRNEWSAIKAFLTRTHDRYRPPYGRYVVESARQCVFAGSTNKFEWIGDETGGRRFWPVSCGRIDIDAIIRDRDQLWAEAKWFYGDTATWWLDAPELIEEAKQEQAGRYRSDPWESAVLEHAEGRWAEGRIISISEILTHALQVLTPRQDPQHMTRVVRILTANGWVRKQRRMKEGIKWTYVKEK